MNQRIYLLLLLLIIVCLLIPSGAAAQYTITKISGDGQTGNPGQTLNPFIVQVLQNGAPPNPRVFVTFLHDRGSSTGVPVLTDENGRAQSTLTLGRGAGVTTITASVPGGASVTFTATAVLPPPPKRPPEPTQLVKISADNQLVPPGGSLTFVFELQDLDGNPKPKVDLNFVLFGDGTTGSLNPRTAETDADGRAGTTLTLTSDAKGTYEVEGYNSEDFGVYVSFTVTVDTSPPRATGLEKISGGEQSGYTGEALANPFVVEVRDQFEAPLEDATVTFAITAGGGTLSTGSATTDANGRAESTLTLGNEPGTNTVEVSVEGGAETEIFNAEATRPPPTPTTLSMVSGDDQEDSTGGTSMDPLVVEVIDQDGDPLEGVTVTFTILGEDGSQSTTTVTTDEKGRAEITLPPGTDPGTYTVTASVEGIGETVTFTVVVPFEFDLSLSMGFNLIHLPLKVRAIDGRPAEIQSVSLTSTTHSAVRLSSIGSSRTTPQPKSGMPTSEMQIEILLPIER